MATQSDDEQEILREAVTALDRDELVLFVGAGLSRAYGGERGLPLGSEVASGIASDLLGRTLGSSESLMQVAQEAVWRDGGSRQRLDAYLKKTFGNTGISFLPAHSALASIGAPIITTNYDNLIERAFESAGKPLSVAWKDEQTTSIFDPLLIKIHGTIDDPTNCVITEDDYYHWFDREPELRDIVRGLLLTKTLCFVGYSLADPNFRAMLRVLRFKFAQIRRPGMILTHKSDPESYDQRYVKISLGLRIHEGDATAFLQDLARRGVRSTYSDISHSEEIRTRYFSTSSSSQLIFTDFAAELVINELASGTVTQKWSISAEILRRIRARLHAEPRAALAPNPCVLDGFATVPAGPFIAGGQRHGNELIRIETINRPFRISVHTTTNFEYREFLGSVGEADHDQRDCHPDEPRGHSHCPVWADNEHNMPETYLSSPQFDDYPVVFVDWWDAYAYCRWKGGRLPTDLEWERAARGVDGRLYPWGDEFRPDLCNTEEAAIGGTVPVSAYHDGSSPVGAIQLSGNIWEWCEDRYFSADRHRSVARIVRGGSFSRRAARAECAFRNGRSPGDRWCSRGIRVAIDLE